MSREGDYFPNHSKTEIPEPSNILDFATPEEKMLRAILGEKRLPDSEMERRIRERLATSGQDRLVEEDLSELMPLEAQDFLRKQIEKMLEGLTERQSRILTLRFGFEDGNLTRTQAEVGEIIGFHRTTVGRDERAALAIMRANNQSLNRSLVDPFEQIG